MNRHSADLYPMRVNPFNFSKGDVVKKVITDNVKTPYVGVVTAIVPSTNKVEVQWPHSMGIEDPWDLIKVNPIIHPPVVNEDKSYKTYQNELSKEYFDKIRPHRVIDEYVEEEIQPILLHASDLYNKGFNKEDSFKILTSSHSNLRLVKESLQKVFSDEVDIKKEEKISVNGDLKHTKLELVGNEDKGFKVSCLFGEEKKEMIFDNLQEAVRSFKGFEGILNSLESASNYSKVVGKVADLKKKSLSNPGQYLTEKNKYNLNDLETIIRQDIIAEHDAINLYKNHLERSDNEFFNKTIEHIIEEEEEHVKELQMALESLKKEK